MSFSVKYRENTHSSCFTEVESCSSRFSTMRPNHCLIILYVFIFMAPIFTVEADSEDCIPEIKVRRGTVYEIFVGQDLTINCTVGFCNNSPPEVSWFKAEENTVPVNSHISDSHIKTQWKELNHREGVSHLIFQKILSSDSGLYRCQSGNDVSHAIKVSVHDCTPEIKVRRGTVYEIFVGQDLTINCTVGFCSSSPPEVSWYKLEETDVRVKVNSDSHIKTEWTELNHGEGVSYLIFQKILSSDSGLYRCQSGNDVSHNINVSVHGGPEQTVPETFWLFVYRVVGIMAFVIAALAVYVLSKQWCKETVNDPGTHQI